MNASKPRQGDIFRNMQLSRANFKYALRWCKKNDETVKADAVAFDVLGGATGHTNIADMWHSHVKELFSTVKI